MLQLLTGRWGSDVVLRYVMEAPLGAITSTYREKSAKLRLNDIASQLARQERSIEELPLRSEQALAALKEEVQLVKALLHTVDMEVAYVVNTLSQTVHLPLVSHGPPIHWRTRCGWSYGSLAYFKLIKYKLGQTNVDWPFGTPCSRCVGRSQADEVAHAVPSSDSGSD